MMRKGFVLPSVALVCLWFLVPGCESMSYGEPSGGKPSVGKPGKGPPPHAPAHGYRAQHADGTELVFDSGLGVYAVVGSSDRYFQDGLFFRLSGDLWEISAKLKGPWDSAAEKSVPKGLKDKDKGKQQKKKGKAKGKPGDKPGRGKGPKKK